MQAEQIFQQPNAGDTVNRRDAKGDAALLAIGEIKQSLLQGRFVEKSPLPLLRVASDAHAGGLGQFIKMFKAVFGKNFMHCQAAVAAKDFLCRGETGVAAGFSTMKACNGAVFTHRSKRQIRTLRICQDIVSADIHFLIFSRDIRIKF